VIDIHTHILPEVDDGPKSWDVAVEMCRMAATDGVEHMVATPHCNERYHYDRAYLSGLLDHLRQLVDPKLQLSLGCDFHASYDNLQDVLARPEYYTIEGTNYLLFEFSNYGIPAQIDDWFNLLGSKGVTAIVTHPERNPILQQTPQRVLQWAEQGCVMQVTASALTGGWGERVRRTAEWLLERNAVHVLASDCHDSKQRKPLLSPGRAAAEDLCGPEVARALVDDNPRAIVQGQVLPFFPNPVVGR
jgi:protein-tyrosine phosphatase